MTDLIVHAGKQINRNTDRGDGCEPSAELEKIPADVDQSSDRVVFLLTVRSSARNTKRRREVASAGLLHSSKLAQFGTGIVGLIAPNGQDNLADIAHDDSIARPASMSDRVPFTTRAAEHPLSC